MVWIYVSLSLSSTLAGIGRAQRRRSPRPNPSAAANLAAARLRSPAPKLRIILASLKVPWLRRRRPPAARRLATPPHLLPLSPTAMGRHRSFLPPPPSTCPSRTCAVSTSPSASSAATLPAPDARSSVARAAATKLRILATFTDVVSINKWRFMKLKEHMQGDIDVENEAYERYTENIGLLEETFCLTEDAVVEPEAEATSSDERMEILVSEAKVRLKSDNANADSFKERISTILDQKLKKLQGRESAYEDGKPSDQNLDDHTKPVKLTIKQQMARTAKMNELLGKLTRAQSEDDLKPFLDIMALLFGKENGSSMGTSNKSSGNELLSSDQESTAAVAPSYSFPKLWTRMEVDVDMMSMINDEFSSSSQVVQL